MTGLSGHLPSLVLEEKTGKDSTRDPAYKDSQGMLSIMESPRAEQGVHGWAMISRLTNVIFQVFMTAVWLECKWPS